MIDGSSAENTQKNERKSLRYTDYVLKKQQLILNASNPFFYVKNT